MIWKKEFEDMILEIPVGFLMVNNGGIITEVNTWIKKILQRDEEFIGNRIERIIPDINRGLIIKAWNTELEEIIKIDNRTILLYSPPVLVQDKKMILLKDISNIVEMVNESIHINETNYMLEAIIDSIQDAVSVVDEKGNGILINKAYTHMVGLTPKDVINKPATIDIVKGESVHMKVLETGKKIKGLPLKVGLNKTDVIISGSPIIIDGKLRGSMAIARDISEIKMATKKLKVMEQRIRDLESKYSFDDILGNSAQLEEIKRLGKNVAATDATVLLRGESGVGKELFAHAIHEASNRKKNKFIRVNCSALTDSLISSELFGYEDGAFTGGKRGGQKGLFEEADGGTIFLDEVGELDLNHQAMLLRVLNEKEILRVGGTSTIPVDVRIIAATNIELEEAIKSGQFREDLYYRLMVYPIHICPLRQRKDDIPILINFIIKKLNSKYGRAVNSIDDEALEILKNYDWPGNVRELENIIGRAMINMHFKETIIEKRHLPPINIRLDRKEGEILEKALSKQRTLKETVAEVEKRAIENALNKTNGNRSEAADILGISIRTLYYKIREYELS